jgi:hypothetical protein
VFTNDTLPPLARAHVESGAGALGDVPVDPELMTIMRGYHQGAFEFRDRLGQPAASTRDV